MNNQKIHAGTHCIISSIPRKLPRKQESRRNVWRHFWSWIRLNSLIKNKTQTAVINILNLHILIKTWRFVCTLHTFSKVTVEINNSYLYITKVTVILRESDVSYQRTKNFISDRQLFTTCYIFCIHSVEERIRKDEIFWKASHWNNFIYIYYYYAPTKL